MVSTTQVFYDTITYPSTIHLTDIVMRSNVVYLIFLPDTQYHLQPTWFGLVIFNLFGIPVKTTILIQWNTNILNAVFQHQRLNLTLITSTWLHITLLIVKVHFNLPCTTPYYQRLLPILLLTGIPLGWMQPFNTAGSTRPSMFPQNFTVVTTF